jgi:3-deoxy-D-manno-octulosonic-acid transferase
VPKGGHNIMEPASWGKPILYGPNMDDFKDAQDLLESAQAGLLVKNSQDICERILYFHKNQTEYLEASKKALQVAVEQHDSAKRQARIIEEILNKN